MPDIKFCGLTRPEDARVARELGARFLGVIFAGGPRLVTPERALDVLGRRTGGGPIRVGVFGDQDASRIAEVAQAAELDAVQLHGDPDLAAVGRVRDRFAGRVWAVVRVEGSRLDAGALAALLDATDAVVLDAKVAGRLGGTGVALDWAAIRRAVEEARGAARASALVVLAGGLTPENVAEAVRQLDPDVVDVSSGVEREPGIKDHDRMRAFARAARAASERATGGVR
ncbi:MAG: phosphoribosylanthranilate isomerase [Gemmatimonadaceae bacterium]